MNKINISNIIFLIFSLLLLSCEDKIYNEENINSVVSKADFSVKKITCDNFIPSLISENYNENNNQKNHHTNTNKVTVTKIGVDNITDLKASSSTGRNSYSFIVSTKEKLIPLSSMSKIYLGAVHNGLNIEKEIYSPLNYNSNPFNISISAPLTNVTMRIDKASFSKQREVLRTLFNMEPSNKVYNPEEFIFQIKKFSSYDELQFVLNSELNTKGFLSKGETNESNSDHKIYKKTGLYIKCLQRNFSLDMDMTNGSDFVSSTILIGANNPIYVSSICYGKIVLLAVESNSSYEESERVFRKVTEKFLYKKTVSITNKEIEIINNSTITIFSMAESGAGFKAINGYQEFVDYISNSGEWGKYSSKEPGVPLYSSFSYLKDNSLVNLVYDFKINIPPVYARIEYRNIKSNNDVYKTDQQGDVYLCFYSDPRGFNETNPLDYMKINLRKRELEVSNMEGSDVGVWSSTLLWIIRYSRADAKENYSRLTQYSIKDKKWNYSPILIEKGFKPIEVCDFNYYDLSGASGIADLCVFSFGFKLRIYSIEKDWYYKILPPDYGKVDYGYYTKK